MEVEAKWVGVALLYGPPERWWRDGENNMFTIPMKFRMALEKFFDPEEVRRVTLRRFAYDYAHWYETNEDHQR